MRHSSQTRTRLTQKAWSARRNLSGELVAEDGELLTEGEILQSQLRAALEESAEEQEDDSEDGHRDLPERTLLTA